jgi:hypothetical protein
MVGEEWTAAYASGSQQIQAISVELRGLTSEWRRQVSLQVSLQGLAVGRAGRFETAGGKCLVRQKIKSTF